MFGELMVLARKAGRRDIARAIAAARRRYRWMKPLLGVLVGLQGRKGLWRVSHALRPIVMEGIVR